MYNKEQWLKLAQETGEIVAKKNASYGDSVRKVAQIIKILYPKGVSNTQIPGMLFAVRIVDKLSRIANDPLFGGEDPAQDIAGYGLLMQELLKNGLEPHNPSEHK